MNQKPTMGRSFVSVIITFFLIISLFTTGILFSLNQGILKGDSLDDLIKNAGGYSTIEDITREFIAIELDKKDMNSEKVLALLPEGLFERTSKEVAESIVNGSDLDLSFFEEECDTAAKNATEEIVADVSNSLGDEGIISISELSDNDMVQQYSNDYNIDVSNALAQILTPYGDRIDLSALKNANVQEEISDAVYSEVEPAINDLFSSYIDEINESVNAELNRNSEYQEFVRYSDSLSSVLHILNVTSYAGLGCCILLILFNLLIYGRNFHYGIKNSGIAFLLSGLPIFSLGMMMSTLKPRIMNEMEAEITAQFSRDLPSVSTFVEKILDTIFQPYSVIGSVYMILFVVCIVIFIVKKTLSNRDKNQPVKDSRYNVYM